MSVCTGQAVQCQMSVCTGQAVQCQIATFS
jgi:hypothetical protein